MNIPYPPISISHYTGVTDNTGRPASLADIVEIIGGKLGSGTTALQGMVNRLRKEADPKAKDALKKKLPAVTWSGLFKQRAADKLQEYSGLICIDIDKLSPADHPRMKSALSHDPFTRFLFTSPSGAGLKVIIEVQGGPEMHLQNFLNIEDYYWNLYNVAIDKSGKDICRLCFLSYDPGAAYDPDSQPFPLEVPALAKPAPETPAQPAKKKTAKINGAQQPEKTFADVETFTNQKEAFTPGNRNNWIHLFACNANRAGFPEADTLSHVLSHYLQEDMRETEIKASIHSAYKNAHEHGKFSTKKAAGGNKPGKAARMDHKNAAGTVHGSPADQEKITEAEFSERYQFFDIQWKVSQDEDGSTTRTVKGIQINYLRFLAILTDLGFRRIDIDKGHYFIHIEENIIQEVDDIFMKSAFKAHLETMPEVIHINNALLHRSMILNYILGRQNSFFDRSIICHLPVCNVANINEDTRNEAFFYYRNKCVRVTGETIDMLDYSVLEDKLVWEDSILERDIKLLAFEEDEENNLWAKFLLNVCDGDGERMLALMRLIGYLMHKYYEGKMKAIVFTDSRISDNPEGRTGKGLIFKGIKHMMNRDTKADRGVLCTINGKEFNPDNERRYEKCDINTRVIHINDVRPNYDVERHYNEIEEGVTVNKKFQLPFTIHAKIGISTNRTLKINGDSSLDRFFIFDLSSHYSKDFTPEKEFKKWFFRDFTEHEWNLFDTFMLHCMQFYLQDGLVTYKSINLEKRIMHEQIGEELVNFLEDFPNAEIEPHWGGDFGLIPGREYEKRALYQIFLQNTGLDPKKYRQRWFTNKLRHYKHYSEKWENDHQDKDGQYHQERRANGRDYIWFVEAAKKPDNGQ